MIAKLTGTLDDFGPDWAVIDVGGVGYLPAEYLIGRADRIIFSSAGRSLFYFWTWRADRFFKAIE